MRKLVTAGLLVLALMAAGCASATQDAIDTGEEGQSVGGQVRLTQAATVATAYFAENGSYSGFTAAEGEAREPSLEWADGGGAQEGVVAIDGVTPTSLVLVTASGGNVSCLGITSGVQTTGTQDAGTAAECS